MDNEFYKTLGHKWYSSQGDAVALLRIENETKAPWVKAQLSDRLKGNPTVLDVGCGGGFLSLCLSQWGCSVTALDVSEEILNVGRSQELQQQESVSKGVKKVSWICGQAEQLPFQDSTFEVICMMDVLEHLEDPKKAIVEAFRVLKEDGLFVFHTFNRTFRAWLFAAKGLDWFLANSQKNIHDWDYFIKPEEIREWLWELGCEQVNFQGISPDILSKPFLKLALTRRVPIDFRFKLTPDLAVGYLGATKKPALNRL